MNEIAAPAAPQFISREPRSKIIDLDWPLSYDGFDYHAIEVRRLTAGEVEDWQKAIAELPDEARIRMPIYFRADGQPVPEAVLRALEDDDKLRIDQVAMDFTPRRFRAAPANATGPADGANTGPSSPA